MTWLNGIAWLGLVSLVVPLLLKKFTGEISNAVPNAFAIRNV
jgi:hypothetical protein